MLGVAVFIYALTDYLSRSTDHVQVELSQTEP
jgi:hypothetical protein